MPMTLMEVTMKRRAASRIKQAMAVAGLAASILIAGTSLGFAHSGTAEEQAACTPDVFRLCFFDIPNEDRIVACLNRNLSKLSPACHDVMAPKKKEPKKAR